MQENKTRKICGVGRALHGLYYLVNLHVSKVINEWRRMSKMETLKIGEMRKRWQQ